MSPVAAKKIYRRPDPSVATGKVREFRPRVCCAHTWGPNVSTVTIDGIGTFDQIQPGERCIACGATCKRDAKTQKIVEYASAEENAIMTAMRNFDGNVEAQS